MLWSSRHCLMLLDIRYKFLCLLHIDTFRLFRLYFAIFVQILLMFLNSCVSRALFALFCSSFHQRIINYLIRSVFFFVRVRMFLFIFNFTCRYRGSFTLQFLDLDMHIFLIAKKQMKREKSGKKSKSGKCSNVFHSLHIAWCMFNFVSSWF